MRVMHRIVRTLLVFVFISATAQAGLFDYFRNPSDYFSNPSGLYVCKNALMTIGSERNKSRVGELDFRRDNTFTWKEYDVLNYDKGPEEFDGIYYHDSSGTWNAPFGAGSVELHELAEYGGKTYLFKLDGGDLIEQAGKKRRFVKKQKGDVP